jgi:DeoR family fructose operon transcriptional repressor
MNIDSPLFAEERRQHILQILELEARVSVAGLADQFHVSEDTIRRDLRRLDGRGLLSKTHGGALRRVVRYEERTGVLLEAKKAIGRKAAELVERGDTIIIDSGTTTLCMANALRAEQVRVLTNSLEVAQVIATYPQYELIVFGGKYDTIHHELVGRETVQQIHRYRVDKLFMGFTALDRKKGPTDASPEDAEVKRAMIGVAQKVIGLADHSKLGQVALAWVAPLSVFDILVTDEQADTSAFEDLNWNVIKVPILPQPAKDARSS